VHNWSGFDSILLFKYLQPHFKIESFIFDRKMIATRLFDLEVQSRITKNP